MQAQKRWMTVKWNAVENAVPYRVFYKTSKVGWTISGTTTGTSFTATGLTVGTSYTFTVRCVSDDGE